MNCLRTNWKSTGRQLTIILTNNITMLNVAAKARELAIEERKDDMNTIQNQIIEKLGLIEAEHKIKIPLAVESGSRAWGFASPDSDYDCRFVYVRPRDFYLSVFEQKDTIDYTPDAIFDLSGWDLKKFISHLVRSNAVMLEWLQSNVIYRKKKHLHASFGNWARPFSIPFRSHGTISAWRKTNSRT